MRFVLAGIACPRCLCGVIPPERYGKHFLPPASLVEKAERGEKLE